MRGRVFVISGPSGGGKTTVIRRLRRRMPRLVRSVSVTTRPPRRGERDGRDYQFVSPAAFETLRRSGGLLEWARVHGARYGTPATPVRAALARGRSAVLSIDVQGARQIRRALGSRAVLIFLLPPSVEHLWQRLLRRRTETIDAIRRRLAVARRELASAAWYDYTVVNDQLDHAVKTVEAIMTMEQRASATHHAPRKSSRTSARRRGGQRKGS
jgi:guanylate kinase